MKGAFDPATAAPIPTDEARVSHVIKHLLAPRERWDLVTDGLPRDPIAAGAAEGCGPIATSCMRPRSQPSISNPMRMATAWARCSLSFQYTWA